jgi:hypothetical protein
MPRRTGHGAIGNIPILVAVAMLSACASGSAVVTGTPRPALDPNTVQTYSNAPTNYEVIGVVKASSDAGLTEQQSMNYAIAELKKQAAAIGANGLIITGVGGWSGDAALAAQAIRVK